jgi:conjugal transfer pilus assembly protein TraE
VDRKIYNSLIENSTYSIKTWMKISMILLMTNLLLIIFLLMMNNRENIIVVPANFKKQFSVQGQNVSPAYIEQMTFYFSSLLLNYNKHNVEEQFNMMLQYFSPEVYLKMRNLLSLDQERIIQDDVGSVFYPMSVKVKGLDSEIDGEQLGIIGTKIVKRELRKYKMKFNMDGGTLKIESFQEN